MQIDRDHGADADRTQAVQHDGQGDGTRRQRRDEHPTLNETPMRGSSPPRIKLPALVVIVARCCRRAAAAVIP